MPPSWFGRMRGRLTAAPVPQTEPSRPTEEELQQDQEIVQKAISEAVTAALNNDDFTKSVAAYLATQLQPTLKAALDISTVEENLSKRLDEIQTATTARLSDISNDLNSYKSADRTSVLEDAVSQINGLLAVLGKDLKAVQNQIAQQDTTILSAHSTKLDGIATNLKTLHEQGPAPVGLALSNQSTKLTELATELKTIQEQIASPDNSLLASHTTKLDAIAAEIVAAKENNETTATLKSITSDLAALKSDINAGTTSNSTGLSGLVEQLTSVQSAIDAQSTTLSDIKALDASSDILAGIKASNASHASHATALSTIASNDSSADIAALKSQVTSLGDAISDIKNADATPEILAAVKSSNESHAAHASTLADIKAAASTPAPIAEKVDLSTIEASVKSILTGLESQNAELSEIKTATSTTAPVAEKTDISGLETDLKTLITNLNSHASTLSEIKTSSSGPEILAAIEVLKTDVTASKAGVAETKEQVDVIVNALPKVKNEAVLTELEAVKSAVDSIQIPKIDYSEIISEVKTVKTLVSESKDAEILAEVKEIKIVVEKNAALVKVEKIGESDKGVEVEKSTENGSNGVAKQEKVEA